MRRLAGLGGCWYFASVYVGLRWMLPCGGWLVLWLFAGSYVPVMSPLFKLVFPILRVTARLAVAPEPSWRVLAASTILPGVYLVGERRGALAWAIGAFFVGYAANWLGQLLLMIRQELAIMHCELDGHYWWETTLGDWGGDTRHVRRCRRCGEILGSARRPRKPSPLARSLALNRPCGTRSMNCTPR